MNLPRCIKCLILVNRKLGMKKLLNRMSLASVFVAALVLGLMVQITSVSAAPDFTVQSRSTLEGDSGSTVIQARIDGDFAAGQKVGYRTKDGSASVADNDYAEASGLAVCPQVGNPCSSMFVDLTIYGDTKFEGNEFFYLELLNGAVAYTSGTITITNDDTPAPTLHLPGDQYIEATGPDGAIFNYTATATDDNPANPPVFCDPESGSLFPIGQTDVDCIAVDFDQNFGVGSFKVNVQDTTPPAFSNVPNDITVEATSLTGAVVNYTLPTATDLVDGEVSVTCNPLSGGNFPIGTTTITCTAADNTGNQAGASFDIIVTDATPPTLSVPADITTEATSPAGAVVNFSATATDNIDSNPSVVCAPASGNTFPLGTTQVTCTATDAAGNSSSGSFNVTVQDTISPVLTVPADITTEATGYTGAVVNFSATATDIADSSPTVTCNPASGSTFPLGTTTVNCSATDDAGNTSGGSFDVTVVDTTSPVLTVPADITAEATGPSGAAVSFNATATDIADDSPTVICDPASGSTFPLGTTLVECSVTDASGNSASGSFNVIVEDTTIPSITVPAEMTVNATSPNGAAVNFSIVAFDLADTNPDIACQPASGSVFGIGQTTVTCTVMDDSGNVATDSFQVTVKGAADQLVDMADIVKESNLSFGLQISLSYKLGMTEFMIEMGRTQSACSLLDAFSSQVQSLSGNGLTAAEATSLLESANRVKAVAGCTSSPSPPSRR